MTLPQDRKLHEEKAELHGPCNQNRFPHAICFSTDHTSIQHVILLTPVSQNSSIQKLNTKYDEVLLFVKYVPIFQSSSKRSPYPLKYKSFRLPAALQVSYTSLYMLLNATVALP